MSLLSGLLGPAINVATKAAGDYQGAQAQRATADQAAVLQRAQLVRQQQQQAIQQAVAARQAEHQTKLDRIAAIKAGPGGQLVDLNDPNHPQNVGPVPAPKKVKVVGPDGMVQFVDPEHPPMGLREHVAAAPQPVNQQVIQTDQGTFQIDPKTGKTRPVVAPDGTQFQKPLGASTQKAIATNITTVGTIDKALQNLKTHTNAVGIASGRGMSDKMDQYLDPEGVDTRALVANVGSQIIHDRSGAAVTVSEYPRLAPFVPSATDNAETVKKKLKQLRAAIAMETEALGGSVAPEVADDTPAPVVPAHHDRVQSILERWKL